MNPCEIQVGDLCSLTTPWFFVRWGTPLTLPSGHGQVGAFWDFLILMGYPIYPPELEIDVSSCKCVDAESRIPPLSRFLSAKEAYFTVCLLYYTTVFWGRLCNITARPLVLPGDLETFPASWSRSWWWWWWWWWWWCKCGPAGDHGSDEIGDHGSDVRSHELYIDMGSNM